MCCVFFTSSTHPCDTPLHPILCQDLKTNPRSLAILTGALVLFLLTAIVSLWFMAARDRFGTDEELSRRDCFHGGSEKRCDGRLRCLYIRLWWIINRYVICIHIYICIIYYMDWYNRQCRYVHLELFSTIWHGFNSPRCYTCKSAEAKSLWRSRPMEWHCFGFWGVYESVYLCVFVSKSQEKHLITFIELSTPVLLTSFFPTCLVSFHLAHLASASFSPLQAARSRKPGAPWMM